MACRGSGTFRPSGRPPGALAAPPAARGLERRRSGGGDRWRAGGGTLWGAAFLARASAPCGLRRRHLARDGRRSRMDLGSRRRHASLETPTSRGHCAGARTHLLSLLRQGGQEAQNQDFVKTIGKATTSGLIPATVDLKDMTVDHKSVGKDGLTSACLVDLYS